VADRDLHDLRALVTGASKGIGNAVPVRLREAGATVLATARTPSPDLPNGAQFVTADVTTANGCATVAEAVAQRAFLR
jgi:NAD(P)-dependent dehydrogenase (short-subunit alcohol dehydrogenase family)